MRLCGCAGLSKPLLVTYVIRTIILELAPIGDVAAASLWVMSLKKKGIKGKLVYSSQAQLSILTDREIY